MVGLSKKTNSQYEQKGVAKEEFEVSFTIKCDKCGNEQTFKQGDKARNTDIDMEIGSSDGYQPYPIEITIFCENHECNNMIDLKY